MQRLRRHLPRSRPTSTRRSAQLAELRAALADASASTGGRAYNPGWNLVFELGNLLTVSEAITRSARQRTESRGAHSRLDFPATDDDARGASVNSVVAAARRRHDDGRRPTPLPDDARRAARPARPSDH